MQHIIPKPKITGPLIIGHRGVAGLRPENTLCSFRLAAELGLSWIELDVQLSKDDQWMVMHDDLIDRTTNGQGKISDSTAAELSKLEAGLWFKPPYRNEAIPTLKATMDLAAQLGLKVNIEIKCTSQTPAKHAALMRNFIQEHLADRQDQIILSSFDTPCIVELRKLMPDLAIGYLIDNFEADTIEVVQKNNFDTINCDVTNITEADLALARKHNIPVYLYTIDDPTVAAKWFAHGVTAVFTNRGDLLLS